jgi:hypothetical protein
MFRRWLLEVLLTFQWWFTMALCTQFVDIIFGTIATVPRLSVSCLDLHQVHINEAIRYIRLMQCLLENAILMSHCQAVRQEETVGATLTMARVSAMLAKILVLQLHAVVGVAARVVQRQNVALLTILH